MNIIDSSISFFNTDLSGGYLWIMIILSVTVLWAISLITGIIIKIFSILKQPFKDLAPYIKKIIESSDDEKKKEKKKEYDKAINRILESENLMIIGRYLTTVVSALLLVLVVVIIGLVIIIR